MVSRSLTIKFPHQGDFTSFLENGVVSLVVGLIGWIGSRIDKFTKERWF